MSPIHQPRVLKLVGLHCAFPEERGQYTYSLAGRQNRRPRLSAGCTGHSRRWAARAHTWCNVHLHNSWPLCNILPKCQSRAQKPSRNTRKKENTTFRERKVCFSFAPQLSFSRARPFMIWPHPSNNLIFPHSPQSPCSRRSRVHCPLRVRWTLTRFFIFCLVYKTAGSAGSSFQPWSFPRATEFTVPLS